MPRVGGRAYRAERGRSIATSCVAIASIAAAGTTAERVAGRGGRGRLGGSEGVACTGRRRRGRGGGGGGRRRRRRRSGGGGGRGGGGGERITRARSRHSRPRHRAPDVPAPLGEAADRVRTLHGMLRRDQRRRRRRHWAVPPRLLQAGPPPPKGCKRRRLVVLDRGPVVHRGRHAPRPLPAHAADRSEVHEYPRPALTQVDPSVKRKGWRMRFSIS